MLKMLKKHKTPEDRLASPSLGARQAEKAIRQVTGGVVEVAEGGLKIGLGTAMTATSVLGGKLEEIHQNSLAEARSGNLQELVKTLTAAGKASLTVWRDFIKSADPDTVEQMAQVVDITKPLFYGADVVSLCERLLFVAMEKVENVRERVSHMRNLERFIRDGIQQGVSQHGEKFAPPKEDK